LSVHVVREQVDRLAAPSLDERRALHWLDPERAPVIVAGATIVREVMAYFGIEQLDVSERDLLDGAALAAAELPEPVEGDAPPGAYPCC
jgi:exopolyphosphatase/guanosine-5'-triphosphate,3'-diphosphate pyrophosphatase